MCSLALPWNVINTSPKQSKPQKEVDLCVVRGGHQHLQIGQMLDIDLISEPPPAPSPQMYVYKVWESVWPEGQEAIHSWL